MDEKSCSKSSSNDVQMMHAWGKGGKEVMLGEHWVGDELDAWERLGQYVR
jgi:hypothetical protein